MPLTEWWGVVHQLDTQRNDIGFCVTVEEGVHELNGDFGDWRKWKETDDFTSGLTKRREKRGSCICKNGMT